MLDSSWHSGGSTITHTSESRVPRWRKHKREMRLDIDAGAVMRAMLLSLIFADPMIAIRSSTIMSLACT